MKHLSCLIFLVINSAAACHGQDWRGYPWLEESGWVDTGSRLGFTYAATDPWIWSEAAGHWLYLPAGQDPAADLWTYWMRARQKEVFAAADMPVIEKDAVDNFKLLKPWNYDKDFNARRRYPLIVSLHGATSDPNFYYTPCIVGKPADMQQYPCFFLAPNSTAGWSGTQAQWLMGIIEKLVDTYRIDENRIYLMGFSMGGSGSYSFANTYYDTHARLFAGIVRVAGGSQIVVRDAIALKTSIWYHIGLEDTADRVVVARQCYQFLKDYPANAGAVESTLDDAVYNYPRTTWILKKEGVEIVRYSEYTGLTHQGYVAFLEPGLLRWLFAQSLTNR